MKTKRNCIKLKWWTKAPKNNGLYLFRESPESDIQLVHVFIDNSEYSISDYPNCRVTSDISDYPGQWSGPIKE